MHDAVITSARRERCAALSHCVCFPVFIFRGSTSGHSFRSVRSNTDLSCLPRALCCQRKSTQGSPVTHCVVFFKGLQWMCATHSCKEFQPNTATNHLLFPSGIYVYIQCIYNIWCSILSSVTPTTIWQPLLHCTISNLRMKSVLCFCNAEISSIIESRLVCGRGMRCNDCTPQHVLDGPLSVCTLVWLVCVESCTCQHTHTHVYASAWVAGRLGPGNSSKCHFAPKWLLSLYFFKCCHVCLLLSPPTNGRQCCVSVPNNEQVHFSPEVFVVGINVNAWLQVSCSDVITNTDVIIYICLHHVCCDLTLFRLLLAVEPPSDLKFKIINENTVEMSWTRPSSQIEGFRIQVVSDTGQYGVSALCCVMGTCQFTEYTYTPHPNSWFTAWRLLLDEPTRDFTLDAYTSTTSITDLTPDLDYSVSINSVYGSEESIPIFGQLTSKYKKTHGEVCKYMFFLFLFVFEMTVVSALCEL